MKKGARIILKGEPYEILEGRPLFKGRGHSILQAKLKNLITGKVISRTFHPREQFEEAELSKIKIKFIYSRQNKFYFAEEGNPSHRFELTAEQIGNPAQFLKPNQVIEGIMFEGKLVNIALPIKVNLRVIEAPPGIKAGRAEPGTKIVTLETGAKINTPLFVKKGDIIEVNTQTGEYVRRL